MTHANDAVLGESTDASDELSFDDSDEIASDSIESNCDVSDSALSNPKRMKEDEAGISSGLRRRLSFKHGKSSNADSSGLSSSIGPEIDSDQSPIPRERNLPSFSKIEGSEKKLDYGSEKLGFVGVKHSSEIGNERADVVDIHTSDEVSTVTDENADVAAKSDGSEETSPLTDEAQPGFLLMLAGAIVRAIIFQITLLYNFLTFPIWLSYKFYTFLHDPFGFSKRVKARLLRDMKLIADFVYEWLKEHNGWWSFCFKCCWVFLRLCYVCIVLVGLLLSAFAIGGLLMRVVVEEPVRMNSPLNFDFKEKNPVALVPLMKARGPTGDAYLGEKPGSESRIIPPHHKFQVTVTLTLPESDYNRNLGIFQVRVEILTANGKARASSKRPCMLKYRSKPIRLLLTLLKAAPIITGYISETQDLNIKFFQDFIEGKNPSAFLRVAIEQRAEFLPAGGGVPEIYAASVTLETQLPLLKRLMWSWRRMLLLWVGLGVFTVELGFVLVCCGPFAIPRIRRLRGAAAR